MFNTICQGTEMEALLSSVPVVLANGRLELPNTYSVSVDDRYGAALAVEHLAGRRRKNIFYVKGRNTVSAQQKMEGFLEVMERHGLARTGHVIETGETLEAGMAAAQQILGLV